MTKREKQLAQKAADSAIEAYVYEAAHAVANAHNKGADRGAEEAGGQGEAAWCATSTSTPS